MEDNLTRKELVENLLQAKPTITRKQAVDAVDGLFEIMQNALREGKSISVRGFGVFAVRSYAARKARNLATGEAMMVPPGKKVVFRSHFEVKNDEAEGV